MSESNDDQGRLTLPYMVRWFSPTLLANAAIRAAVSPVFGTFADARSVQANVDGFETHNLHMVAQRYDLSEAGIADPLGVVWVDYLADTGDGFDSTYAMGAGQILAIIIGVFLGVLAAWKARSAIDYTALFTGLLAWSLPAFWLGIILVFWGSNHGFPIGGKATPGISSYPFLTQIGDIAWHLLLPTFTYTVIFMGEYTLLMRSSLMDVLAEDYILTAKAKGLSTFQILKDHALKNGMLPMVTLIAINLGYTVGGVIQIEAVFSWPGLGGALFEAVSRRDFPILQGGFLLIAVSVIIANFIADLTYSYLDPRVQTE